MWMLFDLSFLGVRLIVLRGPVESVVTWVGLIADSALYIQLSFARFRLFHHVLCSAVSRLSPVCVS